MAITITGTPTSTLLYAFTPIVEVKQAWSDAWITRLDLEMVSASHNTAGQDLDRAVIRRRYGYLKEPFESAASTKLPIGPSDGWWIRILFFGPTGWQEQWVGRISGYDRDAQGAASFGPSGSEGWPAYGPAHILRRCFYERSAWIVDPDSSPLEQEVLGWSPDFNSRDERGTLVGNRSADRYPDSDGYYCFGGTDTWTNYDAVEYLIKGYADESAFDPAGPTWTLGGQADLLKGVEDTVALNQPRPIFDILRDLIPLKFGLDFKIISTAAGFEIVVFSLSSIPVSFRGASLPGNPSRVRIDSSTAIEVESCRIEQSNDWGFGRVRCRGKRIVACFSLFGSEVRDGPPDTPGPAHVRAGSLEKKWDAALETEYLAGTGTTSDAAAHDQARRQDKFKPVFQQYGAAADWDWHDGTAAPYLDANGAVDASQNPDRQNLVRATLDWLPLREGIDYTTVPETDNNPADHTPDLLPPAAWVSGQSDRSVDPNSFQYFPAETVGVSVSVPKQDWGVHLSPSPVSHVMAFGTWSGAAASEYRPEFDWRKTLVTIAAETDQCFAFELAIPNVRPSGGWYVLDVPEAEFWWLAPNTVVAVDGDGAYQTGGTAGRVLRDDSDRLAQAMAGLLSRYLNGRNRAELVVHGLLPWAALVGQILEYLESGATAAALGSVITSVHWTAGKSPSTTIRAGFAQ